MNLAATLFCAVTTLLSVQAITVSVDRADVRPVSIQSPDQGQSMFVNGWRPLTNNGYDNIGVNVSPSSNLDRSLAPLHPVLGKLQEHMAVSERLKPQRRNKPQQIEYNPPSILGSFAVFSHASSKQQQNPSSTDPKTLSTEREYSFLVPPPRDTLRFELEPHKKAPLRDSEPFVRSSQFIPQAIKPDSRSPTYFIKPASYSTAVHPFSQGRPFVNGYNVDQSLIPPRHPSKQFDELKSSNDKPYYQPPNVPVASGFNKENNKANPEQPFDRFQPQQASQQVINGNYYNQINHPSHYKQSTFEREPSFLVHESHDVSYVTPPSYKFRPATYHFENPAHETYSPSTVPPRIESNKFTQQTSSSARPDGFKSFQSNVKDKHHPESHHGPSNTFYINDFQKTRYNTPDINEVLPKANQPAKFNQVSTTPSPYLPDNGPKFVYVRPELQQQQYQSSIIPLNINQRPTEVEYATPEEISLKHFNQQQFMVQQQLIQQDRQRLKEQEKRRQHELQRQQQEEINKRQQEIKLLEQKQKEKQRLERLEQQRLEQRLEQQRLEQRLEQQRLEQRLEQQRLEQQRLEQQRLEQQRLEQQRLKQQQTEEPDIIKEVPHRHHYSQQYPVEEQKKVPKEQYKYVHYQQQYELPQVSSEPPFQPHKEDNAPKQVTVQKFEEVVTPPVEQHTTQEEFQPVIRPYRPQKPFRDQVRRRKPTTVVYDPVPTESPTVYTPETQDVLTDIPIQTTTAPETTTVPVTERVIVRTRRPGSPLRRRRPSTTTTTTPEPSAFSQEYEEEIVKYNTPEIQDFEKKKRVRPVASNHQDSSVERRPLRKRPSQRVKYNKDHSDLDSVPERVRTTEQPFREISATENYPAPFLKELYASNEYTPIPDKTVVVETPQEVSTESIPIEFYSETTVPSNLEYYEPTHDDRQEQYTHKAEENTSIDHVFTKTELNYVETTTEPPTSPTYSTTTTTTTTTTTEAPSSPKAILSSPKATQRMRPVRYGNATRPRFSVKDYKSRMEYKSRLAQSSSTEATSTVVTAGPKQRGHKNQQAPADPSFKEPSGRYKYMSRSSYRTTSTTIPTSQQTDDSGDRVTTDRSSSRYTPKKRINTSHYYRSRVSGSTSATPLGKQDQEHSAAHSTVRPENVFSSSIRKRPTLKSRLQQQQQNKIAAASESPEMQSAAETGFFATTTVPTSSAGLTEAANEIAELEEAVEEAPKRLGPEAQDDKSSSADLSDVTMDEAEDGDNKDTGNSPISERPESEVQNYPPTEAGKLEPDNYEQQQQQRTSGTRSPDSTTPFDLRHEEELFAKASQSVADLTSSASALYDKPGMFKAVSPAGENRVISAHLKIATDEPTLPIEAFFHEISKKN